MPQTLWRLGWLLQSSVFYGHETEHRRLRVRVRRHLVEGAHKMVPDTADHQVSPRLKKTHHFNTVLEERHRRWHRRCRRTDVWLQAWILSPVYAVCWIIDQDYRWIWSWACRRSSLSDNNFPRLRPNIIHDGLVEPADHKIDRTTCLDDRFVGQQHVVVPEAIVGI